MSYQSLAHVLPYCAIFLAVNVSLPPHPHPKANHCFVSSLSCIYPAPAVTLFCHCLVIFSSVLPLFHSSASTPAGPPTFEVLPYSAPPLPCPVLPCLTSSALPQLVLSCPCHTYTPRLTHTRSTILCSYPSLPCSYLPLPYAALFCPCHALSCLVLLCPASFLPHTLRLTHIRGTTLFFSYLSLPYPALAPVCLCIVLFYCILPSSCLPTSRKHSKPIQTRNTTLIMILLPYPALSFPSLP